jgi:hypothetical protein
MKKALLAVIALLFFSTLELSAQCNPDLTLTTPGIVPDSATGLADGMIGQAYSDTLQFRVPTDTTIASILITINWIRVDTILGLPPGFNWSSSECGACLPHHFNGGTNGCLLIYGPPLAVTGTWPLKVMLTGNGTSPFGTITLPDSNEDYSIQILPLGIATVNSAKFDVLQNYPNPFNLQTEIAFTAPTAGRVDFRVYDLLGREMIVRNIEAVNGLNKITLSSRYFKPGIYFYKLNYKNKSLTRKMIVTAKP